ncbi:MAG: glycine cleavage T C-terminal barrel domain-containing protein [Phycisphaerales bacterium]
MTTQSPLHASHQSAEAFFISYGPPESQTPIVETFGDLDMEYAAIRKGCVVFDEPHMGTLKITGPERHEFLNNMLTAKIDDLKPGKSLSSFWLNRQGRIDADLHLIETDDALIVKLDRHLATSTAESLNTFLFAEDCQIEVDNTLHWISLHGPTALALLDTPQSLQENQNTTTTINNIPVIVDRADLTGETGLNIGVAPENLTALYTHLIETQSCKRTGWLAINAARIEAGHPLYNIDFGPDTVPAETSIMDSRVNLTKGCYLGQEVVARMHARNIRKQGIVGIRLDSQRISMENQSVLQPMTGAYIYKPGEEGQTPIGAVTSSTISPMLGAIPICFAMIKDAHTTPGTELIVAAEGAYTHCTVTNELKFWSKPNS